MFSIKTFEELQYDIYCLGQDIKDLEKDKTFLLNSVERLLEIVREKEEQIKISDDDSSILSEHTGSFKIKYKLTDSLDNSLEYSFLVNVVCLKVVKPK